MLNRDMNTDPLGGYRPPLRNIAAGVHGIPAQASMLVAAAGLVTLAVLAVVYAVGVVSQPVAWAVLAVAAVAMVGGWWLSYRLVDTDGR